MFWGGRGTSLSLGPKLLTTTRGLLPAEDTLTEATTKSLGGRGALGQRSLKLFLIPLGSQARAHTYSQRSFLANIPEDSVTHQCPARPAAFLGVRAEKKGELCLQLPTRPFIPLWGLHPHGLVQPQGRPIDPLLTPHLTGIGAFPHDLGGGTNVQWISPPMPDLEQASHRTPLRSDCSCPPKQQPGHPSVSRDACELVSILSVLPSRHLSPTQQNTASEMEITSAPLEVEFKCVAVALTLAHRPCTLWHLVPLCQHLLPLTLRSPPSSPATDLLSGAGLHASAPPLPSARNATPSSL